MGQRRFWNWKDDDATIDLSNWLKGFLPHGVYYGFDADLSIPGLDLNLIHSLSGNDVVLADVSLVQNAGTVITKQGTLVREDSPAVITISAGDATYARIDLIVCQHSHEEVVGGTQAIYLVIEGTPSATPVAPALTDANKQTILGYLTVTAGCGDLSTGASYSKAAIKVFSADDTIVRTDKVQTVTAEKTFNSQKGVLREATISGNDISLPVLGNYYFIDYIDDVRKEINDIVGQPGTAYQWAYIFTKQKIVLSSVNAGGKFYGSSGTEAPGTAQNVYIDAGEGFIILNDGELLGTGDVAWAVLKGGEAGKNNGPKFLSMVRENKGGALTVGASGEVDLEIFAGGGNFFDVGTGAGPLKFIQSAATYENGGTTGEEFTEAGTRILLRNTTGSAITIEHNASSPIAKYKPVLSPIATNISFEVGALIMLVEDLLGWRVIGYNSATKSPFASVLDDNTDVTLTSATNGDVLFYNGSMWINTNLESKIANAQHSFTKIQSMGVVAVPTSEVVDNGLTASGFQLANIQTTNALNGNIFEIDMVDGRMIRDIQQAPLASFPTGSKITLRIKSTTALVTGMAIQTNDTAIGKLYATSTDTYVSLQVGDTLELYKSPGGKWYIIAMNGLMSRTFDTYDGYFTTLFGDITTLTASIGGVAGSVATINSGWSLITLGVGDFTLSSSSASVVHTGRLRYKKMGKTVFVSLEAVLHIDIIPYSIATIRVNLSGIGTIAAGKCYGGGHWGVNGVPASQQPIRFETDGNATTAMLTPIATNFDYSGFISDMTIHAHLTYELA